MSTSDIPTLVLQPGHVVTVDRENRVLRDHAVVVRDRKIAAVLPVEDARRRWPKAQRLELPGHALMPGLVNAHTHLAMNLFRGLADDLPLMSWLQDHIWPAEGKWVADDFVHDGSLAAMAEMIRGGITTFADMYFFPNATARAAQQAGLRAVLHAPVLEFPTPWAQNADEYIHKALLLRDDWKNHPLITVGIGPHAPYTVNDPALRKILMLTNELTVPMPVQMHVHETAFEVHEATKDGGPRPLARLHALGMTGPSFQCVHMTQIDDADLEILATSGSHVIHCPESNLKLASGFCPVGRLQKAGVNVALGTDGGASNNDLDLFSEMRTAALLAKAVSGDATACPATAALRMATINGAKALGLDAITGSIEAGKQADLIAVDLSALETQPLYNIASQLVYATGRHQVTHSWVAGEALLADGELTTLNAGHLKRVVAEWAARIKE
ncbi:MAG: TRZ/ATZ family hydrolase [Gammaproteobacteria bacterium]